MQEINKKIDKLLNSSILLKIKEKKRIRKKLENSNIDEKQRLISILESEKTILKKIISNYLEENGEDGIHVLKRTISQMRNKISNKSELIDKEKEISEMENLLNKIESDEY